MADWNLEYTIDIDEDNAVAYVKVYGQWRAETAERYHTDFKENMKPLLGKPWAKVVDLTNWKTSRNEVTDVIGKHMAWSPRVARSKSRRPSGPTRKRSSFSRRTGSTRDPDHRGLHRGTGHRPDRIGSPGAVFGQLSFQVSIKPLPHPVQPGDAPVRTSVTRQTVRFFRESNHLNLLAQRFEHDEHLFCLLDIAPQVLFGVDD